MATNANAPADWKTECTYFAVLYRIIECGDKLPVVAVGEAHEYLDSHLTKMAEIGLLTVDRASRCWVATQKGREALGQAVAMLDHALKFEIFAGIELTRVLTEDECMIEDPSMALDFVYDPRFLNRGEKTATSEDLRLAMIVFQAGRAANELNGLVPDPHRIVFLQKLGSGRLRSENFWSDLAFGSFLPEIEAIVAEAYQWTDIAGGDPEASVEPMEKLFLSGMRELRKRQGFECQVCRIPLGVYEAVAQAEGRKMTCCPNTNCNAPFVETAAPPPVPGAATTVTAYDCPACGSEVYAGQSTCRCGARIDFSLPAGTVTDVTTATTTTEIVPTYYSGYGNMVPVARYDGFGMTYVEPVPVWGGYASYGYQPYGYYDMWGMTALDIAAFACLAAVIW